METPDFVFRCNVLSVLEIIGKRGKLGELTDAIFVVERHASKITFWLVFKNCISRALTVIFYTA